MHNDEIIALVKKKFTFIDIIDYRIIDNIICISCDVDNKSNYFILYPHGDISYKYSDYWSYESAFNQEGYGNGIIFIDKQTIDVIKAFYYKDDLCLYDPIKIAYSTLNFIITEHEERTHIIFIDDFSVLSFGGTNYKIYENYILFFPYHEYSQYDTFCILNTESKNRIDLYFIFENKNIDLINEAQSSTQADFFHWNENISDIEYSDFSIDSTETYLKYKNKSLYEIEALFKNKIQFKHININKQYLYNIQKIKSIPNAFSLDIHSTKSFLNDDGTFDTTRTYIGELLYQIKYRYVKNKIQELSEIITIKIRELFGVHIDVIIPVPPSNLNRPFQPVTDEKGRELETEEILKIFKDTYFNTKEHLSFIDFTASSDGAISKCTLTYRYNGKEIIANGEGNGPIDACKKALMKDYKNSFNINSYSEHSCGDKSSAKAVAYIEIQTKETLSCFGVGVDNNIAIASIKAMFCALNRAFN